MKPVNNSFTVFCHTSPFSYFSLYDPAVTSYPSRVNIQNSTFFSHSKFMCLVWISEKRYFLYSINGLIFTTEIGYVYCAVGAETLRIISVKFSLID